MNLASVITILRTYPSCDIDRTSGQPIRKNVTSTELTEDLLSSYTSVYGNIRIYPRVVRGAVSVRVESEMIELPGQKDAVSGLSGVDSLPAVSSSGNMTEMYKLMYDNEKESSREYKRKYEDILTELRKLEVEHAGSKNSVIGDIASGLAGFAPMLMGGAGVAGLGNTTTETKPAIAQTGFKPIDDKRLAAIIQYYQKLGEENKVKVYSLLAKVFGNLDAIDQIIQFIDQDEQV